MAQQKDIDDFVSNAKVCEINAMITTLIDHYGAHTIVTMIALDCARRAEAVLQDWQDAHTSQRFKASQDIVLEAADKLAVLVVATA